MESGYLKVILTSGDEPYVWVANKKDKLEKRKVKLGEYDEALGEYEIKSGLSQDDYIAYPMDGLYEGVSTVTDASEVDYSSPLYNQEGESGVNEEETMPEDGMSEDGGSVPEDGMSEDGEAMPEGKDATDSESSQSANPAEEPEG